MPRETLPDQAYGPASIFYRDDRGKRRAPERRRQVRRADRRDRSVTFTVENPRAEQVCEGTFTNDGPAAAASRCQCFGGKFAGNGTYESKTGSAERPHHRAAARRGAACRS